ncbi:sortase A [Lachnospiraceae bacterium KH1T2]|nr:sortase A [Lachnospiraceae bacterium KH1T2]
MKGKIFIILGLLCILGAFSLYMHNIREDENAGKMAAVLKEGVMGQLSEDDGVPREGEMPAVDVDGHTFIGIITIPSLDLELPINREWSRANAKIAPCRYKGSAYENNLIIAAHNYSRHFGRINELMSGDEVIITDVDGHKFTYEVVNTETLGSYDVDEMEEGDWDLTIFTCTIGGRSRVTVRCVRH